jgi:hypothetical protein
MQEPSIKLNPWEDWLCWPDSARGGYIGQLVHNILIHPAHTKKDRFIPHQWYNAIWFSEKPKTEIIDTFVENARKTIPESLGKGEYFTEEKIGGEFQSVKKKFNAYYFWDKKKRQPVGELKTANKSKELANAKKRL